MDFPFATVDVFTSFRFGGNPLAVFHQAAGLSDELMQALAAEMNLSETTFVLPPLDKNNSARVRIFNRTAEMDFAGHPNVGTAYVLAQLARAPGEALRFEENAGLVAVRLIRENRLVTGAEVSAPQPLNILGEFAAADVAACVGVRSDQMSGAHPPSLISVGAEFVVCNVQLSALEGASADFTAFRDLVANHPELGGRLSILIYANTPGGVSSRMFSPIAGTWEDPATGSAHAALAAFRLSLCRDQSLANLAYEAVQGVEMGRPSHLFVHAWRATDGIRASVAGKCAAVFNGHVSV